jgi:hypothetical protein
MPRLVSVALTLALFVVVPPASAQDRPVSQVLADLIAEAARIGGPYLPFVTGHETHFANGPQIATAPAALNLSLGLQLATFPMGPTSGGMVFSRDGSGDSMHETFGTSYSPRGLPLGRGHYGTAITFQNTTFGSLDGVDLRGGGINFLFGHSLCCPPGVNDVLQETVYLHLNRKVTSFVLDYGVTNRLDIGFVVPVVQMAMTGRVLSRLLRVTTTQAAPTHVFDQLNRTSRTTYLDVDLNRELPPVDYGVTGRTARGIGDIVGRAKVTLVQTKSSGLAASVDVAFPTGSSENFLGTGSLRVKPGVAWSGVFGRVSPHVSGAYTYSQGKISSALQDAYPAQTLDLTVPREIEFAGGVDAGVAPRVTLVAEAVGRRVLDVQRFALGQTVFSGVDAAAGTDLIANGRGDLSQMFVTVGGRFNLGGTVFANAHVFFPVSVDGLKPNASAAFSLNYGF